MRPDTLSRTSQDSHDIKPETLPNQSKPVGSQTHSRESSDASYITYVVWWRGNLSSKQVTIVTKLTSIQVSITAMSPSEHIAFRAAEWLHSRKTTYVHMASLKFHLWAWFTQLARSNENLTKFKKDLTVNLDILMYNKVTEGILLANISHVSERWIS